MNYFAHAIRFLDDPFFLSGTALPDWLSVVDRRSRVPSKSALRFVQHHDHEFAALARGVVQHHRDDARFHGSQAFLATSAALTAGIRQILSGDEGFRPAFLGHILVEILLDADLIREGPLQLARYYQLMDSVDAARVAHLVGHMATRPVPQLEIFIPLFSAERFLYDYSDDAKLLKRLNRVLQRVGLPTIDDEFLTLLPDFRQRVRNAREELFDDWTRKENGS
jgi:hypothetical protein